jgi:hypothetical protein
VFRHLYPAELQVTTRLHYFATTPASRYPADTTALAPLHGRLNGLAAHRSTETTALVILSRTTADLKVYANIQCVCAILHRQRQPHFSFCPGQRQTSEGQREHSVRVRDTASTETTALFILSKTATGLSVSTRTFGACAWCCIDGDGHTLHFVQGGDGPLRFDANVSVCVRDPIV